MSNHFFQYVTAVLDVIVLKIIGDSLDYQQVKMSTVSPSLGHHIPLMKGLQEILRVKQVSNAWVFHLFIAEGRTEQWTFFDNGITK